MNQSSVTRAIDPRGTAIKTFRDEQDREIQAMALVDENGNQIAVSGNPIYIALTGTSDSIGASGNPLFATLTSDPNSPMTSNRTGSLAVDNEEVVELLGAILLELRQLNLVTKVIYEADEITLDDVENNLEN